MPYDPVQGQVQGGLKFANMTNFKGYLLRQYAFNQKTNGNYDAYSKTISKF